MAAFYCIFKFLNLGKNQRAKSILLQHCGVVLQCSMTLGSISTHIIFAYDLLRMGALDAGVHIRDHLARQIIRAYSRSKAVR